jgi:hypothetical protein
VESWTQTKRHLVIRYEDLLAAPTETFGRIIRYLGDAPDPRRLQRAIDFSTFQSLAAQEREAGYTAHAPTAAAPFFRTGQTGQWRSILTAAQAARLETAHAPTMRSFGYLAP